MLRKHCNRWLLIVVCVLLLSACIPYSFSPPKEVHINPGDSVSQAQVAVDAEGVSHIVGLVNNRIVYYRTRYGEPITSFAFTMGGSGDNWVQFWPGIAVTDDGTSYIVWTEQNGGPEKFACWSKITYIPPIGGWSKVCNRLDGNIQTTRSVEVVARGNKAYAVYDRMYMGDAEGRIGELMYKELTQPTNTGRVYSYLDHLETAFIYSLDLGIDSQGYLHVGLHENYTTSALERLLLHSNASVESGHDMAQHWFIYEGNELDEVVPVSLSFHLDSADVERVALASISQASPTIDLIYIDSCVTDGCTGQNSHLVDLPSSWDTYSTINDIEILGIGQTLYLSFIGSDDADAMPQVYFMVNAYGSSDPVNISQSEDPWKLSLQMTKVEGRDPDWPLIFPATAWVEAVPGSKESYFVFDGFFKKITVFSRDCETIFLRGDISSNGVYFSGAWFACNNTWFSTQAWTSQLPLIVK